MDCDFSHDPADVPRLIAAAADADLVLGSRYVQGGAVANWGLRAPVRSRAGGSLYARVLLGVAVRDLTGGFKCYRRAVLETHRPRRDRTRRATPSRSRRPTARCAPASASSRSRSASPTARSAARR